MVNKMNQIHKETSHILWLLYDKKYRKDYENKLKENGE